MKKTKKILSLVLAMAMVLGMSTSVFAEQQKSYEINTVKELKVALKNCKTLKTTDGIVNSTLVKRTKPQVIAAFIEEKTDEAINAMNDVEIDKIMKETDDGVCYGKQTIDIGDGCQVIVEFEDGEDKTLLAKLGEMLIEPAYAATNGEVLTKGYGNRYFTASTTILTGIGGALCKLENHYKLSADGIDERYGDAYASFGGSVGITGTVTPGNVVITDWHARTAGASDVNMYARFNWSYSGANIATVQGSTKLTSTVGYMAYNKMTKEITVKHSWTVS